MLLLPNPSLTTHISAKAVADLIGVTQQTVRNQINAGNLPALRYGPRGLYRIDVKDFCLFCRKNAYGIDQVKIQKHLDMIQYIRDNCPHGKRKDRRHG